MNNKEILQLVIERAEKRCWNFFGLNKMPNFSWDIDECRYNTGKHLPFLQMYFDLPFNVTPNSYGAIIWEVIFDHDFAKAFWGEEKPNSGWWSEINHFESLWETDDGGFPSFTGKRWQYHLQQIVLEAEPLKYLEKFL